MRPILQIFLLFVLFFGEIVADEFEQAQTITLKKDEIKETFVKYGDISKLFKFSWTLYKNSGLVVHRSYDGIVAQNILYLRGKNRAFRLKLKPTKNYNSAYMLVRFKEFKDKQKEAVFELFLFDTSQTIKLKAKEDAKS